MKQLCSTYSISGSSVTLTGVNVPLAQILLVSDATTGSVLYSMAGPAAMGYTQGANSTIALATAPGSPDKLTIYYDDGAAVANGPTSVSVSNLPATQAVSGSVSVSNLPATQTVSGTVTANAGTNLNTSALALETGGNLATVATKMSDGTQTASIIIPASFKTGQAKIVVTGTAVQLASNTLTQGVLISALSTNTASITIGTSSGVTNTVDGTGNGSILTAGSTKSIAATNTNLVWINGTAGDIISFIGS